MIKFNNLTSLINEKENHIFSENDEKILSKIEIEIFILNLKNKTTINDHEITLDKLRNLFSFSKNEQKSFDKIVFRDCKIDRLKIETIYLRNVIFENCEINEIEIKNCNTENLLKPIKFDGGKINNFKIINSTFSDNLHINHKSDMKLEISNLEILDSIFEKDFSFYNSIIENINIRDCDFNSLSEFINVEFLKKCDFQEITYKGFTLFDDCKFNAKAEFKYIIFEKITSFRNSIFIKGIDLEYISTDKEINFYKIKISDKNTTSQETYRIIKNQFEKLNNKIEANKYHALEMEQHRKSIWKSIFNDCNSFLKLLPDGIVLLIHKLSSNHSSNWFLALFWIFVVSLITSWSLDAVTVDNFFKYINILSKIEDFNSSYIAMTLNKVSLGYLYYQFLTAVRKDTRK